MNRFRTDLLLIVCFAAVLATAVSMSQPREETAKLGNVPKIDLTVEKCRFHPEACVGGFIVWTDANRILHLNNCSGDACGAGEIPANWLRVSYKPEEREMFPYDEIVLPSDGFRWYWTALKFHWQYLARK